MQEHKYGGEFSCQLLKGSKMREKQGHKTSSPLAEVKKGQRPGEETQQFWRVLPVGCPLQLPAA